MAITQPDRLKRRKPSAPNSLRRKTGPSKGTRSGLRRGQIVWQKDPDSLARIENNVELSLVGLSAQEIAERQGVSVELVYLDRKRARELTAGRVIGSIAETVSQLRWHRRRAAEEFEALREFPAAQNRPAFLREFRESVESEARLLGQESARKVDAEVTLHDGDRDLRAEVAQLLASRPAVVDAGGGAGGPAGGGDTVGADPLALAPDGEGGSATAP
jgi:DNA-binding CsgD family transcriptional regulator